jgi:glycosyltransferase involved in cell wall biosynthesis
LFQGRGPGELALLDVSRKLGPQHVAVHAYAPLDEALSASDVLLLTSRYEGLPLVALEATARGWPIAACRGLGLDELLPPGSLFDFGDAAGLARALESLRPAPARAAAVAYARSNLQAMRPEERYRMALHSIVRALTHSTATSPAC